MRRIPSKPRPNFSRLINSQGLVYADSVIQEHSDPYWPDNRYYSFTSEEIELLEKASQDVFNMCCEAADYLVLHPDVITSKMAIPAFALKHITESWNREPAWGSIYGRFDVCFGGLDHPDKRLRTPKFYEFNADTPTTLVESSSIQWLWLQQTGLGNDQFNSITECLVEGWKRNLQLIEKELGHKPVVHFASCKEPSGEDAMNTLLLGETCRDAGWQVKYIALEELSLNKRDGRFYDTDGQHIDVIFKMYPWEYMVEEPFAEACFKDMDNIGKHDDAGNYVGGTIWVEAPYKMLWSNKALFAIMWDLFKDDPRSKWLLPTYLEGEAPESLISFARKPIYAREGCDVTLIKDGEVINDLSTGYYGAEGYVVQELAVLPEFKDEMGVLYYPVIGLWFVDGEPAGMATREDNKPITANSSKFIPHSISDGPLNYERTSIPTADEIEDSLRCNAYMDPWAKTENKDIIEFIQRLTMN
ncbi:glutathionylspermidine synthase [Colletotrichum truncatum]|uniref:Glutathionylspermidine synthase n=1 Tax=Colletotrichum truncatum TaxID=5467 RepID=A0ACC3ZL46_COLTU|nr:glutathionylspermidine synthase [Colletotrichum truncatum]KAF6786888.1 glutathionylspermidine synthase [Colletotrichum truncatum]